MSTIPNRFITPFVTRNHDSEQERWSISLQLGGIEMTVRFMAQLYVGQRTFFERSHANSMNVSARRARNGQIQRHVHVLEVLHLGDDSHSVHMSTQDLDAEMIVQSVGDRLRLSHVVLYTTNARVHAIPSSNLLLEDFRWNHSALRPTRALTPVPTRQTTSTINSRNRNRQRLAPPPPPPPSIITTNRPRSLTNLRQASRPASITSLPSLRSSRRTPTLSVHVRNNNNNNTANSAQARRVRRRR